LGEAALMQLARFSDPDAVADSDDDSDDDETANGEDA